MGDDAPDSPGWQELLGLGVASAALMAACGAVGWLIDSLLDTVPIFLLVGLLLGIAAAVAYTVRQFRKYLKT